MSDREMTTLTFRICQTAKETDDRPAAWAVHRVADDGECRRVALTPSLDTARIALFDLVPWEEETTFSHTDYSETLFEFTFEVPTDALPLYLLPPNEGDDV